MKPPMITDASAEGYGGTVALVKLGFAAGKFKFTLVDENDFSLIEEFSFEAKVIVDPNGNGARLYAMVVHLGGRIEYLHEYIWCQRHGSIPCGFKVIHVNGITVDNRYCNLSLSPIILLLPDSSYNNCIESFNQAKDKQPEHTLYYKMLSDNYVYAISETLSVATALPSQETQLFNANGDVVCNSEMYYECHYLPCCNIEQSMNEFSVCGQCHVTRYCSVTCQKRDWPRHKIFCIDIVRYQHLELPSHHRVNILTGDLPNKRKYDVFIER